MPRPGRVSDKRSDSDNRPPSPRFSILEPTYAADATWQAFNLTTAQVVVGRDGPGVGVQANAHLATFTYRVPRFASGTFHISVLHDDEDSAQRTFMFPTKPNGRITVESTGATVVVVD